MHVISICLLFYTILQHTDGVVEGIVRYDSAQVWQTQLRNSDDILLMMKLIYNKDVSIWNLSPKNAVFLVNSESKAKVHRILTSHHLSYTVLIIDVQRNIDAQEPEHVMWDDVTLRLGHRLTWTSYPTLSNINEYYNFITQTYPSICKVHDIGNSTEGRSIKMIHITNGNPNNKGILLTSGVHAREWAAITSTLYIINSIVEKFDQLQDHITNKDWFIIPVVNPDGYLYTHTNDRLWRKNRRKLRNCIGVDINRNFKKDWFVEGVTSQHECSLSYAGSQPFTEKESIALRDGILKYKNKLQAFIDFHSFNQLILFPWSARSESTPDFKIHKSTAEGMKKAIYSATKLKFKSGPTYHLVYPASGSLLDWVYASGVKLSFVIEERDNGTHGFLLPSEQIIDAGKEMFSAVEHLAKTLDSNLIRKKTTNDSWF